jgi:hypothetical protein
MIGNVTPIFCGQNPLDSQDSSSYTPEKTIPYQFNSIQCWVSKYEKQLASLAI